MCLSCVYGGMYTANQSQNPAQTRQPSAKQLEKQLSVASGKKPKQAISEGQRNKLPALTRVHKLLSKIMKLINTILGHFNNRLLTKEN